MKSARRIHWPLPLLACGTLLAPFARAQDDDDPSPCERTAAALRTAAVNLARADVWSGVASCLNFARRRDALECLQENLSAFGTALDLLAAQLTARLELCELLDDDGRYDPDVDPEDFVQGVNHPFFPLTPGVTKVFEAVTAEGTEHIEVTTTHDTKTILGVECLVVRDVVSLAGEPVEDTLDYFAQDEDGNVWYFGELAMNFEDGELRDLDGSWQAGVGGAKPGIVMRAVPAHGDVYRQEFLVNVAEDAASVTGLGRSVSTPYAPFHDCLETLDFTPLEPGHLEAKFYAPGVGFVLQVTLETGERTELVAIY